VDEQQIRLLVRQAIARHLGASGPPRPEPAAIAAAFAVAPPVVAAPQPAAAGEPSIATRQFVIVRAPGETECVIEPSVTCNHCGYCLCYGH
jgi:hypothetical protein